MTEKIKFKLFAIALASIFLAEFIFFANTTFTLWPEIVLYPWLHNNGFLLYKDIINPYFPGLTWILSFLTKIFGYDLKVFIGFTWGYIFVTQLFFAYLTQKLLKNKQITFVTLLVCVMLLIIFEENGLWFDLVVTLPLLLTFFSLLKKKYFLTGVFLAIGLLIKQTVVWVVIVSVFSIVGAGLRSTQLGVSKTFPYKETLLKIILLLFPIIILVIVLFSFFYLRSTLSDFFFWTVKLPFGLMQKTPGFVEFPTKRNILVMFVAFWPIVIFLPKIIKDKALSLLFVFFVSSFVFAFPRFGYFHLAAAVPFFTLISAKIFSTRKMIGALYILSIVVLFVIIVKKNMPFSVRFFDIETYRLAAKVKKETKKESFFLQNAPQQIYFVNDVLPSKPWVINFSWYLENNDTQEEIIKGLEIEKIKWIVLESYQKKSNTFTPGAYKPIKLQEYMDNNYIFYKKLNSNTTLLIKKNVDN